MYIYISVANSWHSTQPNATISLSDMEDYTLRATQLRYKSGCNVCYVHSDVIQYTLLVFIYFLFSMLYFCLKLNWKMTSNLPL